MVWTSASIPRKLARLLLLRSYEQSRLMEVSRTPQNRNSDKFIDFSRPSDALGFCLTKTRSAVRRGIGTQSDFNKT